MNTKQLVKKTLEELSNPSYQLQNVHVFLKKESVKGIFTTTITSKAHIAGKHHQLVAHKKNTSPALALQEAKEAIFTQLSRVAKRDRAIAKHRAYKDLKLFLENQEYVNDNKLVA